MDSLKVLNDEEVDKVANDDYAPEPKWYSGQPQQYCMFSQSFIKPENHLRGLWWSPDGTCLLSNSADNFLRLFNLPTSSPETLSQSEADPALCIREQQLIYDADWFPMMDSNRPETCALVSTSRDTPVHLWDAYTGTLRASYRPFNHLDEIDAALCVAFSTDGQLLYCGLNRHIRIFHVDRPGKQSERRPRLGSRPPQGGLISCVGTCKAQPSHYALGSYNCTVGLYAEPGCQVALMRGQQGGVTQVSFSEDGLRLYSGGRKDTEILCWDVRFPGRILYLMRRPVATNQRLQFALRGNHLLTGGHDGYVRLFELDGSAAVPDDKAEIAPVAMWRAHADTIPGLALHPTLALLATGSGQRYFSHFTFDSSSDSDSSSCDETNSVPIISENVVRLWRLDVEAMQQSSVVSEI